MGITVAKVLLFEMELRDRRIRRRDGGDAA